MKKIFAYFNIASHEIPRVIFSWIVKLLIDTSHIIAHTLMLYYISMEFGVYKLPYFLLLEAFIIICVSLIYNRLNIKRDILLLILIVINIFVLIFSYYLFDNTLIFLILFYIAYSVLTFRIMSIFNMAVEDLFTPLEATRTIPVIETSVLFGGLIGGGLVSLITIWHMPPKVLLLICGASMAIVFIIIYLYQRQSAKIYLSLEETNRIFTLPEMYQTIKYNSFIKGLSVLVMLIFFISKIMEFIYTVGINELFNSEHGGEHDLLHGLGLYTIIFSFAGIVIQFFLSQRWIKINGIVLSMRAVPVLNLMTIFSMFSGFHAYPNIISKFVFDVVNTIYTDAYALVYYVFNETMRDNLKPFFEGIIKQIGMILGTVLIICIDIVFHDNYGDVMHILTGVLIIMYIYLYFVIKNLNKKYTELIKKNLNSSDLSIKFKAIENLSQKGHQDNLNILIRTLDMTSNIDIKKKILHTIGMFGNSNSIPYLIEYMYHEHDDLRLHALKAIYNIGALNDSFYKTAFTKYRLVEVLKTLLNQEKNINIKKAILDVFSILNYEDSIPFIVKLLKTSDFYTQLNILNMFLKFDDISICSYVEEFLTHTSIELRCAAITVLYKFPSNRISLIHIINKMMHDINDDTADVIVDMLTKLKIKQEENKLKELYERYKDNISIAKKISIALISLRNLEYIDEIPKLMASMPKEQKAKLYYLIELIEDRHIREMLLKVFHHEIYKSIHHLLIQFQETSEHDVLKELMFLYELIGNQHEVIRLRKLIEE